MWVCDMKDGEMVNGGGMAMLCGGGWEWCDGVLQAPFSLFEDASNTVIEFLSATVKTREFCVFMKRMFPT